jgi:PPOX class probable F420-dependent enzyme
VDAPSLTIPVRPPAYAPHMPTLDDFAALLSEEQGLVVLTTLRADHTMQSSVVNAGVMAHPISGERVVALVARSGALKVANVRARPATTATMRVGWQWMTVEGTASVIGPDDSAEGFDADALRLLLRDVFTAAGGSHSDWDEYDRVMHDERRAAVFVTPTRIYSNG